MRGRTSWLGGCWKLKFSWKAAGRPDRKESIVRWERGHRKQESTGGQNRGRIKKEENGERKAADSERRKKQAVCLAAGILLFIAYPMTKTEDIFRRDQRKEPIKPLLTLTLEVYYQRPI